jgi:hypothetical protein
MKPGRKIKMNWTSDPSGDVDTTLTKPVRGFITRVITTPGSGGDQPTDDYDLTCLDEQGVDVFKTLGGNRDDTNVEDFSPAEPMSDGTYISPLPVHVDGTLQLVVANAGDTKKGEVVILMAD